MRPKIRPNPTFLVIPVLEVAPAGTHDDNHTPLNAALKEAVDRWLNLGIVAQVGDFLPSEVRSFGFLEGCIVDFGIGLEGNVPYRGGIWNIFYISAGGKRQAQDCLEQGLELQDKDGEKRTKAREKFSGKYCEVRASLARAV